MKRRWVCERCGRTLRARVEVRVLFHDCNPWGPRRRVMRKRQKASSDRDSDVTLTDETYAGTTLEERWHGVFADAAGGYQPPTTAQAREETGDHGRRKEGSGRG
jgi:hypothetical protein